MAEQGGATALLASSALLVWAGFALMALCQERHFERFYMPKRPLAPIKRAQAAILFIAIVAVMAMVAALILCTKAQGAGFGSLLWVLLTALAAMSVALQLTWAPLCLKPLAWAVNLVFRVFQPTPTSPPISPPTPPQRTR